MIEVDKKWMDLLNRLFAIPNNWRNVLYVHTPFCKRKCFYCVYSSKAADNQAEMEAFYANRLREMLKRFPEYRCVKSLLGVEAALPVYEFSTEDQKQ